MTTAPNKLERLLCLSATISASTSSLKSSVGLTLKQLIAVHESLLDSIFFEIDVVQPQVCEYVISHEQDQIKRIVKPFVDPHEIDTCVSIISMVGDGNNQKVLLALQYLLRSSKLRRAHSAQHTTDGCEIEHMLEGITRIAFPLLMLSMNYDTQLRDALLDASFHGSVSTATCKDTKYYSKLKDAITECTETITSATTAVIASTSQDDITLEWLHTVVEMSSKVLKRILTIFDNDVSSEGNAEKEDCRQIILNSMHRIVLSVLNATCYYSADCNPLRANGNGTTLLRPITALLLPALFPSEQQLVEMDPNSERLLEIWIFLTNLILPHDETCYDPSASSGLKRCRTWENTAPAVATGILCVLIPSVQTFPFPIPNIRPIEPHPQQSPSQRLRLVYQSFLWDFLRKTLRSGVKTSEDWAGGAGFGDMSRRSGRGVDDTFLDDHMLVRRRTIHIMQLLIDREHLLNLSMTPQQKNDKKYDHCMVVIWKKYLLCFEALEMEKELHLVDQIWDTVSELCTACKTEIDLKTRHCTNVRQDVPITSLSLIPPISWEWVGSLLARVLLSDSPALRKLALFRFLIGKVGVSMSIFDELDSMDPLAQSDYTSREETNTAYKVIPLRSSFKSAPLSIVAPSFVLEVLLPSYDSLGSSGGTGVQFEVDGVKRNNDLTDLIGPFLTNYMRSLGQHPKESEEFVAGLLTGQFINGCRTRTLVLTLDAILASWSSHNHHSTKVHISDKTLENSVKGLQTLLSTGSIVHQLRHSLMHKFALLLSHSSSPTLKTQDPKIVLKLLALFPSPIFRSNEEMNNITSGNEELQNALATWLSQQGEKWTSVVGAACAASFVSGDLLPFAEDASRTSGVTLTFTAGEQSMGESIAKLCALSVGLGRTAASGMLWPAISRGLSSASVYSEVDYLCSSNQLQMPQKVMHKTARAILLLQSGCNEYVLNGMGHGDLIVDKKSETMLPPPPNIELLLTNAMKFILYQISTLCKLVSSDDKSCGSRGAARSGASATLSSHFTVLIEQIMTLRNAYPSSAAIPQLSGALLSKFLATLLEEKQDPQVVSKPDLETDLTIERVRVMCLTFATLAFGAEVGTMNEDTQRNLCADCRTLLKMTFVEPQTGLLHEIAQWQLKAIRSMYQLAKWGALSYLVPLALSSASSQPSAICETCDLLFENALESVNAAPPSALLALFETSVVAAKHSLCVIDTIPGGNQRKDLPVKGFVATMNKILDTLFSVMDDTLHNPTKVYMLEKMCSLIFRSSLLLEEYSAIRVAVESGGEYNENTDAPILKAFHKLVKMAGSRKPYILKYVLSYITVGWLGPENNDVMNTTENPAKMQATTGHIKGESQGNIGVASLPYREDIAKLLVHKEMKLDECASHQQGLVYNLNRRRDDDNDKLCHASVPAGTTETSTARAFLLVFLSKLPDVEQLSDPVRKNLCHYLIFWLLDNIACCPTPERGSALMTGSVNYSRKIRAWQSLCLLARFVTADVADAVMEKVFVSMTQTMHGQIRYFLEAFTIQCARLHPEVFRSLFVKEICRYDLPQQLLSSLMIIGGNLVVGRYSEEFFDTVTMDKKESTLRSILSGVIPWLGSTQGFCRAIAQLLAHKLIPHVLHLRQNPTKSSTNLQESDWFLKSIFEFLDINPEMQRLRQKQSNFFYQYDVDSVCTPEGILSLSIDEGDEANPVLLVDTVKQCLIDIYQEGHSETAPNWKQFEDLTVEDNAKDESEIFNEESENSLVNFQRKILPLDSLNLALEHHQQQNLKNAAGRKRQSLIVCATLIDKIPNLAGLARTVEIFAAEKLVVPDARVCKMDNFKSISVTAGEWINIEECREESLLSWLKQQKDDGYSIIGVEQTSSSKCLSALSFPEQTVLLLGKEKEGIPVKFLQMVDTCVEIPQLGIIRSLNVHVSGAIAIWEYTKQMMS